MIRLHRAPWLAFRTTGLVNATATLSDFLAVVIHLMHAFPDLFGGPAFVCPIDLYINVYGVKIHTSYVGSSCTNAHVTKLRR